jgi:hypothetical protein
MLLRRRSTCPVVRRQPSRAVLLEGLESRIVPSTFKFGTESALRASINAVIEAPGSSGTTNGQPIDSSGRSLSQQALVPAVSARIHHPPPPGGHLVLTVTSAPQVPVLPGEGFGLAILIENSRGKVEQSFDDPVTAVLSSNPTGATLGGSVTVNAQRGVAVFPDLTVNLPDIYAIEASAGGVTSPALDLVVTPTPPTPPPPPEVLGSRGEIGPSEKRHSKHGLGKQELTSITIKFNEPLSAASASIVSFYHVFAVAENNQKSVPLKIKSVVYNTATDSVVINLAKPQNGTVEVAIDGVIEALHGASVPIDYMATIN